MMHDKVLSMRRGFYSFADWMLTVPAYILVGEEYERVKIELIRGGEYVVSLANPPYSVIINPIDELFFDLDTLSPKDSRMINRRIVCAATLIGFNCGEKLVIVSARHWDTNMRQTYHALKEKYDLSRSYCEIQGFVDQYGDFYNREEAWVIAESQNQIVRYVGGNFKSDGRKILYSENLY